MLGNSSAFRLTGRALIVAALIGATLAVAPAIGAQVTQGECAGEAVTVNLALGQSPTEDADVILGTAGADLINGLGGNDIICGEGGDDIINAGNGADTVFGGVGDDSINAGQGRDTIYGQGGDDFISGGKGKDTLNGGAGSDELRSNNGTDTINGGTGSDNINGGQKADTLNGDNGDDTIIGGTRPDTIDGGPGQDTINGGGGQDTCLRDLRDLNVICETLTSGPAPTGDLISGDFADDEITVGVFGNPTMEDIIRLTPDFFSADGGADVNFVLLDQQTARDILALDSTDFDALMVGAFDTPQFGQNGWIRDLTDAVDSDPAYGADDIIPSVRATNSTDEGFFGLPFYAESSFIMYNQQIMDDAGIAVPEEPTWDEIAQIARAVDTDEHAGICLRGLAGWGDFGASLNTVVNTFGGTWWEANPDGTPGEAQINQANSGFREAFEFYADLVWDAGQDEPDLTSFPQCLELLQTGQAAMWYDATIAANILEDRSSPLQGNLGVALAPTGPTGIASGWLWSWNLAVPTFAPNPDAATEFIKWATSAQYIEIAGIQGPGGWAAAPPGTRLSTYDIPSFQAANETYADLTLESLLRADPNDPGTTPRPGLPGVQYVGIPEFRQVGNDCTSELSAVLAGQFSVDEGLDRCQAIASAISQ